MRQYAIVDIDGTISDANARAKTYLEGDNPDWDGFYAACGEDTPITPVIRVIEALSVSYNIVFCTGRRESCEVATREWLNRYAPALAHWPILFRKDGDDRHDVIAKPEMLEAYVHAHHNIKPSVIFEDRNSMVEKWRELGYTVFQPANGEF